MLERLQSYSDSNSGSGREEAIRIIIKQDIEQHVDSINVNALGNIEAIKKGKVKKNILLSAHMDEVALMISSIEENGLLKFMPIGGIIPKILPATNVKIGKKGIPGIIGLKAIHLTKESELKTADTIADMFIDIGARSKSEVTNINIGDYAYFVSEYFTQGNYCLGKAFDDRTGCAAITEILLEKELSEFGIIASYNVSEEIGLRGGAVCGFGKSDIIFSLNFEGTTCSDRELKQLQSPSTELGKGPAITFMDLTSITNKKLLDFAVSTAEKHSISYQFKRTITGGTDSGEINLAEAGIPSITISCPIRYIHSPWGILHRDDFENYVKLGKALIKEASTFSIP